MSQYISTLKAQYELIVREANSEMATSALKVINEAQNLLMMMNHPREDICAKLCEDLYTISDAYIRRVTPDEFKHKQMAREGEVNASVGRTPVLLMVSKTTLKIRLPDLSIPFRCPHCANAISIEGEKDGELYTGNLSVIKT